jgi:hypothetical protein
MVTVLTTVVVLMTGFSNISTFGNGRHYPRPVIARTVTVETQRHSPVAKEASPAKDVSPVVATAKTDAKKASITNPKCSPVSLTTTATGTRWVMPKNLGTAQEVPFSADPALGWGDSAAFRRPGLSRNWTPALSFATTTDRRSPTSILKKNPGGDQRQNYWSRTRRDGLP